MAGLIHIYTGSGKGKTTAAVSLGMRAYGRGFIKSKPDELEIVLTGRNAPAEIIEMADYVSEINPIKHPKNMGIPARAGIEF